MAEKKNPKGPSLQDAVPDEHREMAAIVEKPQVGCSTRLHPARIGRYPSRWRVRSVWRTLTTRNCAG